MSALSPRSGIQVSSVTLHTHTLRVSALSVCLWVCVPLKALFLVSIISNTEINIYAPNFEKVGDILVSACPCVCVCVCVFMFEISS